MRRASPSAPPHFCLVLARAARLHVRHLDVLLDAPEVAGVAALHLDLDRLREHLVERPRLRGVDQHAAVAALAREAVLDLQAVVAVAGVGEQMPGRRAEAHEQPVAHHEARGCGGICVASGDVRRPAGEVLAVEERGDLLGRHGNGLGRRPFCACGAGALLREPRFERLPTRGDVDAERRRVDERVGARALLLERTLAPEPEEPGVRAQRDIRRQRLQDLEGAGEVVHDAGIRRRANEPGARVEARAGRERDRQRAAVLHDPEEPGGAARRVARRLARGERQVSHHDRVAVLQDAVGGNGIEPGLRHGAHRLLAVEVVRPASAPEQLQVAVHHRHLRAGRALEVGHRADVIAVGLRRDDRLDVLGFEAERANGAFDERRGLAQRPVHQHVALRRGHQEDAQVLRTDVVHGTDHAEGFRRPRPARRVEPARARRGRR